jgi:hypothetical protein
MILLVKSHSSFSQVGCFTAVVYDWGEQLALVLMEKKSYDYNSPALTFGQEVGRVMPLSQ